MTYTIRLAVIVILSMTLISIETSAQKFKKKSKYTSAGISLNAMNYVGELDPGQSAFSPSIRFTRLNVGATIVHRFAPRLSVRGNFCWGRIKGDDAVSSGTDGDDMFRNIRNLDFRNDIYELKADLIIDLFENRRGLERRVQFTPYGFIGIAGFYHNPKGSLNGEWHALQPLQTEGNKYSLIQPSLPFGVGFRWKIGVMFDLAFEFGVRLTFTDYLDDISTSYIEKSKLGNQNDLAVIMSDKSILKPLPEGSNLTRYTEDGYTYTTGYGRENLRNPDIGADQRGDSNRDWYYVTGIHLTYIFHPRIICPKFRG